MYGLVLEGGGGKGSYHIGAAKALKEMGIEISAVAGVSVGALNGAMIVQGDIDKAYELWYNIDPSMVIKFNMEEFLKNGIASLSENLNATIARIKKVVVERGLDVQPLVDMLRSIIDEDKIRQSPIDFGIVTYDLTEHKPVEIYKENIPQGKLVDYLVASASFPAFKPSMIDGKKYIDGGIYNNLPINLVKDKGYSEVIVVRTFGIGVRRHIDTNNLNITSIEPVDNLGPVLDFTAQTARKNLERGYYDAMKAFKGLKGRRYYVEPIHDDDFFIKYLSALDDEKIQRLCTIFGIDKYSGKRAVFEFLVPKVADLLDLPVSASYEEIAVGLLENIAHTCGIERFKIYNLRGFYSDILASKKFSYSGFLKDTPVFLRNNDLITKLTKNRIIEGVAGELFGNFKSI